MDQPLDVPAIEDALRQAMSAAKAKGILIAPGSMGISGNTTLEAFRQQQPKQVCALGAMYLFGATGSLMQDLDVDMAWMECFAKGFDGAPPVERWLPKWREAYTLGKTLGAEVSQGLWS